MAVLGTSMVPDKVADKPAEDRYCQIHSPSVVGCKLAQGSNQLAKLAATAGESCGSDRFVPQGTYPLPQTGSKAGPFHSVKGRLPRRAHYPQLVARLPGREH